jgi:hypothetical protein
MVIKSVEEYDAATQRAEDLLGCMEGTPEEAELIELVAAIEAWDRRHDDATSWE